MDTENKVKMTFEEWEHYVKECQSAYVHYETLEHMLKDWRDERATFQANSNALQSQLIDLERDLIICTEKYTQLKNNMP